MAKPNERPSTYDFWSASARKAYDEMADRAHAAESKIEALRDKIQNDLSLDDDTHDSLTWEMAMTKTLNEMLIEASTTLDPSQIFKTVTDKLATFLNLTSVYICDYNADNQTYIVLDDYFSPYASDKERISDVGLVHPVYEQFEKRLRNADGYWINYPETADLDPYYLAEFAEYDVKTVIIVPMYFKGELIGFIEGWDTRQQRKFTKQQRHFIVTLATQISGSVQMATLHRAVMKSESYYRTLMNAIPSGVAQIDMQGKIRYTNHRFTEMMECSAEELINQPLETVWTTATTPTDYPDEYQLHRQDDATAIIQVISAPLQTLNGQSDGQVVIFSDITKRKAAEDFAINIGIEQERTQLLSEFIQNASHEFYTPLSVINTRIHMVKRQIDDEHLLKRLSSVEEQVSVIQGLVKSLVDMTKLRSVDTLQMHPASLNQMMQSIVSSVIPQMEQKQLKFVFEPLETDVQIYSNASMLINAFQKLLHNAIRYTAEEGVITLELNIFPELNAVRMTLTDTGIGIDTDDLERIFDSFYRADTARTTRGFGLGLPIAKRIIDLHNGAIVIHSQLGEGTTITIDLPTL